MNWFAGAIRTKISLRICFWALASGIFSISFSQDLNFAKQHIKKLSSEEFHGRGYVRQGDALAAKYLANEFSKYNLKAFDKDYFQEFKFNVNTFPGDMSVLMDGKELIPGKDYVVYPASASIHGTFEVEVFDSTLFTQEFNHLKLLNNDYSGKFIIIDTLGWSKYAESKMIFNLLVVNGIKAAGIATISYNEIYFSVLPYQLKYGSLIIKKSALPVKPEKITLSIQSKLQKHKAVNVIGYIPGQLDSFIVVTAHYDHLGMMGRSTFFPGANDNASGTAMLLDFVRHYSSSPAPLKYSYAFMLFSGEEAGLLGSFYYTQNPLFPLTKIKKLMNFDLMGTGTDGVNVYFGSVYPKEFHKLDSLNQNKKLEINLVPKGVSKRSDQYFFHEKNVPVLYFATLKSDASYHLPGDTFEALPFTVYENLFKLIDLYFTSF